MSKSMHFELSKTQVEKFEAWRKSKGEIYVGAIGGCYEFCFLKTSVGVVSTVKCADGTEIDLTEEGDMF